MNVHNWLEFFSPSFPLLGRRKMIYQQFYSLLLFFCYVHLSQNPVMCSDRHVHHLLGVRWNNQGLRNFETTSSATPAGNVAIVFVRFMMPM